MSAPYSERFILAHLEDDEVSYTVPEGKRAIIMSVSWCVPNLEAPAQLTVYMDVPDETRIMRTAPGANASVVGTELRYVVYAGETFIASCGTEGDVQISGYLLDDPP